MSQLQLGKTLVIANPTSHSGKGAQGAEETCKFLDAHTALAPQYQLTFTKASGDATSLAANATEFETVVALGGDGVIHEVVNGLMRIPKADRPRLAVIPYGSGNDFARTAHLPLNNAQEALFQIEQGSLRTIDIGQVSSNEEPEGTYFAETLSFGVDAAIALDTTDRRAKGTKQQGSGLFLTSSFKLMARAREGYACEVRIDGGKAYTLDMLVFAIQNGPTYGGGFRICPKANPTDGWLDICHNLKHPPVVVLLVLLGMARFGRHVGSSAVSLSRARKIELDFADRKPPCQVDGERLEGSHFEVRVIEDALEIVVPPTCPW